MEPFNIAKVPGVAYGVELVRNFVVGQHASLTRVIAPYALLDPVYLLLLLFLLKFAVTIPLALKSGTDKCKNTAKFCGNTFSTFRGVFQAIIGICVVVFYTMILAGGFKAYGFFSVAAWTSFVAAIIIAALALWAFQITKFASFRSFPPAFTEAPNVSDLILAMNENSAILTELGKPEQEFLVGNKTFQDYTVWHLIQKEMFENVNSFSIGNDATKVIYITIAAAVITLAAKYAK